MRPGLALTALLLGIGGVVACGGSDGPKAPGPPEVELDPTVPVPGDTVVVAIGFDPGGLSPLAPSNALAAMIGEQIQPGLARRTLDAGAVLYQPALAEEWAFSEDGTRLTYTLREGLQWADGTPVTSADVAFTYGLLADPAVASPWAGDTRLVAEVETPDDHTVTFAFSEVRDPMRLQAATVRGILPRHLLEEADRADLSGHPAIQEPTASGPFRLAERGEDQLVLERNPQAPAALSPHLDRVVFRILPEYPRRLQELERGAVDLVPSIEIADVREIRERTAHDVLRVSGGNLTLIGLDHRDPRFSDARVRAALTRGLDRQRIIRERLRVGATAYGTTAVGVVSPTLRGWFATPIVPLPFDARQAIDQLEAAGWGSRDADGIRVRRGQALRFDLQYPEGSRAHAEIAERVQTYWASLGVHAELTPTPPDLLARQAQAHDFDAILWTVPSDPHLDPTKAWSTGGDDNWTRYANRAVDTALRQGVEALDRAEARDHLREVQRLMYEDHAAVFLFWADETVAVDRRIRGVQVNAFTFLHGLEGWYVPHADQRYRGADPLPPPPDEPPPGEHTGFERARAAPR